MPRQGKDRILLISSPPKGKERPSFPSSDDRQARREGRGRARERKISEGSHALIAQARVYISPSGLRVKAPKRSVCCATAPQARREGRGRAREREISEGSHALIAQATVYISPSGLRVKAPKRSVCHATAPQARREGGGRAREREISEGSRVLIAQAIVYISPSGLRVKAPKRSVHGRVRTLSAEPKKTEPVVGSVSFVRKMMEGSSLTGGRIVWLSPIGRVALSCK